MRTITECRTCHAECTEGEPHVCGYTDPDNFPPRTLTLSFDALVTIHTALERHHNWLEDARREAIRVGRTDLERRAELYLRQNQEALNELEM